MPREIVQSFDEMSRVAERHCRETNCCSVFALAGAARVGFSRAQRALARAGRKPRSGASLMTIMAAALELGIRVEPAHDDLIGCTVTKAIRTLSHRETWMVLIRGHIFCIREGEVLDWLQEGRRHRVKRVWRVVR